MSWFNWCSEREYWSKKFIRVYDEHGNAEEDDNFETEDIGTINEFVDDVDVAPSGTVLAIADVVE